MARILKLKESKYHKIRYKPAEIKQEPLSSIKGKIVEVYNNTMLQNEWKDLPYKIRKAEEMKEKEREEKRKKKEAFKKMIDQKRMERKVRRREIRHQMGLKTDESNSSDENQDIDLPPINTREPVPGSIVFRPKDGY